MSARRKTPDRDFTGGALPYFYQKRGTTGAAADPRLIEELIITALQPGPDGTGVGDLKPINRLVREMREASRMFAPFAGKRKCVVFGSARTASDRAEAQVAEAFSRKTSIVKEADANELFPGGVGTMDELLEALTLIQTGKAAIMPVVMVDKPGGSYWHMWPAFVGAQFFGRGLISALDFSLFKFTENVNEAADEVLRFCPVFHSYRHVGRDLVIRMNRPLSDVRPAHLNEHFRDLLASGGFRQGAPPAAEQPEPEIASMPRLIFHFKRRSFGRLRQLIDALNASEPE